MSVDNSTVAAVSSPPAPPPMQLEFYPAATKTLLRVEIIVSITAFLLPILVLIGSYRRRSHRWWFKFPLWAAYVASATLISNALGQMQSATFEDESFSFWAMFLLLVFGSADSICVYSLDESANQMRYYEEFALQSIWVWWMISLYYSSSVHNLPQAKFLAPLLCLYIYAAMKTAERASVLMASSRSFGLVRDTKLRADFMSYEHELTKSEEGVDPTCMEGYKYLIKEPRSIAKNAKVIRPSYQKDLDINDEQLVTVQKVWQCKGRLLRSSQPGDQGGRRKDICLSYALFKILRCRFAGFDLPEYCSQEKTWKLVREGLIPKSKQSEDIDPERVFRVIEMELAFLYDFFYTKYPVVTQLFYLLTLRPIEIIIVIVGCWAAASNLNATKLYYDGSISLYYRFSQKLVNIDVLVTYIVISTIVFSEAVQIFYIVFSDWMKISCLCAYVQKPSWQNSKVIEKMLEFVCSINWKPWQRKLGQYSLLQSFDYSPFLLLSKTPLPLFINLPRKGQKQSRRVKLRGEIKSAVLRALKAHDQRPKQLTNGTTSLMLNGVKEKLHWLFEHLKTQTHVILVWHIATILCEMEFRSNISKLHKNEARKLRKGENFVAATRLSKYCAYLVVFQPGLLPDHPYVTQFIFDEVVNEVREELKGCKSMADRYEKMMKLSERDHGGHDDAKFPISYMGARLGKELGEIIKDQDRLWKVLAEFWGEMMLFLAPSDDVISHARQLANGGEFITHVWALLFHAGIINRGSPSPQQESLDEESAA